MELLDADDEEYCEEEEELIDETAALALLDELAAALTVVRGLFFDPLALRDGQPDHPSLFPLSFSMRLLHATSRLASASTACWSWVATVLLIAPLPDVASAGLGGVQLEVMTAADVLSLHDEGFVVIKAGLDPDTAAAAGAEALAVEAAGGFSVGGLSGHDATVRDDKTVFLHPVAPTPPPPTSQAWHLGHRALTIG